MKTHNKYVLTIQNYLNSNLISDEGFLKDDLENKNEKSLVYVANVIEKYRSNDKLKKKIELLASKRGDNDNDIKRNYENQLVEFHAIYVLEKKMGYTLIDFDMRSNKSYARPNTDCDFKIMKNNECFFAEVKDSSSEIINSYIDDIGFRHFTPIAGDELLAWIKKQIQKADDKGADFLLIRIPMWHTSNGDIFDLNRFCGGISKDIIFIPGKYYWNLQNAKI